MIITSIIKLIPGKIYTENDLKMLFEYKEDKHEKYAFLVIREATLEEYRKEINEMYNVEIASRVIEHEYFYDISMD